MPRIVVQTESERPDTFFSEHVDVCHIEDQHYAFQLCERLAWAVHDGAEAEAKKKARRRRIAATPRPEPVRQA